MIRLIAVEDEKVIRTGLSRHVHWEQLGVDEVRFPANAEEAYAICQDFVPDIITSDIRMPGVDGITMCRRMREWFPESEIIFMTGYADKEYLKAAIDLHAVRYIEKPIQIPEFEDALREAIQKVKESRRQKASVLSALFRDSTITTFRSNGSRYYSIALLHLEHGRDLFLFREELMEKLKPFLEKYNMRVLIETMSDNLMGFLAGSRSTKPEREQLEEMTEIIRECLDEQRWFLTYGSSIEDTDQLSISWEEAFRALETLSYIGWNHVLYPGEWKLQGKKLSRIEDTVLEKWTDALATHRAEECQQILDEMVEDLKKQKACMNPEIQFALATMEKSLKKAEKASGVLPGSEAEKGFMREITEFETFDDVRESFSARLKKLFTQEKPAKNSYTVQNVISYIDKNYGNPSLSIKILADQVGLTPTYLSNLFKKHQGITIGQYISNVRMEQAKRLMKEPQLKFYEIAYMVGYEDINYFAKVFKKANGCTLSEYKERLVLK